MSKIQTIKKVNLPKVQEEYNTVVKAIENLNLFQASTRPYADYDLYTQNNLGVSYYNDMANVYDIYELSRFSDVLMTIFGALRRKVFKGGIDVIPKYENADESQKESAEKFINCCNSNGQHLVEVMGELEDDLNWADDCFLLLTKDYIISEANTIIGSKVREAVRLFPLNVERVIDKAKRLGYDDTGTPQYFALRDRYTTTTEEVDSKTGIENLQAHYKVRTTDGEMYYNKSEILNRQKFKPSLTGGFSPLFSAYNKAFTLVAMDFYVRQLYGSEKPSKKLVLMKSSNLKGLQDSLKEYSTRVKNNPHNFYPVTVGGQRDNSQIAEVINFMDTLEELQFTEVRNEYRNAIGSLYGVSPVFQNDVSTSGGLNNEGLQITVTNEAIESDKDLFNMYVFTWLFNEQMGLTEWEFKLFPNEEEDLAYTEDLMSKKLANAEKYLSVGGEVTFDENGEFIMRPGDLERPSEAGGGFNPFGEEFETLNTEKGLKKKQEAPLKGDEKTFHTALEKELRKVISQLKSKKEITAGDYNRIVDELIQVMDKELKVKSAKRIKAIYEKTLKAVNRELGTDFKIDSRDKNMIEAIKRDTKYQEAFSGFSQSVSDSLREVVENSVKTQEEFNIDKIVNNMNEVFESSNQKLRMIARTESTKVALAARKVSYGKTGNLSEMKFKVIGPNDNRTGEDSKEIKKLVGAGKSWEEIVNIIQTVASKRSSKWIVDSTSPLPRPNWRHIIIKVV